jgi:uncharacterized cupin superfamily protein
MPETGGTRPDLRVRLLRRAASLAELLDWGVLPPVGDRAAAGGPRGAATAGAPVSRTRGVLLHKGEGGRPEAGVWECTPGRWECRVERDEFCYFLSGRSVYTDESGERTEVGGGDAAWFPAGWTGVCEVLETVRKVYVIR